MAPEMFAGLVDPKGDVWGLGVIFFILLFGHPPFEQSSRGRSQIAEGKMQVEPVEWEACCESAKDLLGKMICVSPDDRINMFGVLESAFIRKNFRSKSLARRETNEYLRTHADVGQRVARFASESKFLRATLHLMATLVPDEDAKEVEHLWELLDLNGDGIVTLEELNYMMPSLPDNMAEYLNKVNIEEKGGLTYSEFLAVFLEGDVIASSQNCKEAFHVFSDHDGTIDAKDLASALGIDDEDLCDFMIKDAGGQGGRMDFDTFYNFVKIHTKAENVVQARE